MNMPKSFEIQDGRILWSGQDLTQIAEAAGTPCYVYNQSVIEESYRAYDEHLSSIPHLICYAMKANSSMAVLKVLADVGSSVDVVSGGELFRAQKAGLPVKKAIFSSVGKGEDELREAVRAEILFFNIEAAEELDLLARIAEEEGKVAGVSVRINPDIDPGTHPYISTGLEMNKFGLVPDQALDVYRRAFRMPQLKVLGIQAHIGSQICSIQPFMDSLDRLLFLRDKLESEGISLQYLSVGGGLGIQYNDENPPSPGDYADALAKRMQDTGLTLIMEPGRSIVGPGGILLTRVLYCKQTPRKRFVIVDGAMNDLVRPSLYKSYHRIVPVVLREGQSAKVDVVGPVCETGDFLAQDREMPSVQPGDLLAVCDAGAYGYTMSSNYNSRPKLPEVLVNKKGFRIVRTRQTYEDLIAGESL
ncbi:MAG TPA: diaminopimelate decarboxylase [bacterium]|nr:diaminopimelate decarboxylase [bacterium]